MNRKSLIRTAVLAAFAAPSLCRIEDGQPAVAGGNAPAPAAPREPIPGSKAAKTRNKGMKAAPKAKKSKPAKAKKALPKKKGHITPGKDRLVPANLAKYHVDKDKKTSGGNPSVDNDDKVARMLRGKSLDEVFTIAAKHLQDEDGKPQSVGQLKSRYQKLNDGMKRMNLGNRLRAALSK